MFTGLGASGLGAIDAIIDAIDARFRYILHSDISTSSQKWTFTQTAYSSVHHKCISCIIGPVIDGFMKGIVLY